MSFFYFFFPLRSVIEYYLYVYCACSMFNLKIGLQRFSPFFTFRYAFHNVRVTVIDFFPSQCRLFPSTIPSAINPSREPIRSFHFFFFFVYFFTKRSSLGNFFISKSPVLSYVSQISTKIPEYQKKKNFV